VSKQSELRRRWLEHENLDQSYELDQNGTLWQELIRNGVDKSIAYARVQVEAFCRHRIFLPVSGLTILQKRLEAAGFYFEPHDASRVKVLFPAGWWLMPSDEFDQDPTKAWIAILISPEGERVATIYYEAVRSEIGATITPL
jgi:hypothetical protein